MKNFELKEKTLFSSPLRRGTEIISEDKSKISSSLFVSLVAKKNGDKKK